MAKYLKTEQGYIDASIFAPAQFKPAGKSYLTFSSPKSFTLKVNNATKNWDGTIEYFSADKVWTVWDGTTILSAYNNDGEYVLYLRGAGNTKITGLNANGSSNTYRWVLTGSDIACVGNIENLLDYATVESGQHPTMAEACYVYMFYDCTSLTQAPTLPATTLANYCYCGMFVRCTSLTQAPVLPAITLSKGCYQDMFFGCTSLTQAPTLTATTLADYCYADMFYGCTSLTQAPALSATTLSSHCYHQMFSGCTSLTQTPALPATTLANDCYYYMFHDCTSLTKAPALPATTLANSCYYGMFSGCTSLTQAPALPATTLANSCYQSMFYGCTSLTQVPALPATTLVNSCYQSMFSGCTSLKLSSTKTGEYTVAYRIPTTGVGSATLQDVKNMFFSTGGTFTAAPSINTTYYLSTDNMIVRNTEVATLNGYVGSMIDNSVSNPLNITGATVGQIAKITAVDDSGKPTAWEAVDMPAGGNSEEMRVIKTITITADDVNSIYFNSDDNGLPFALTKCIRIRMYGAATNTGNTQVSLFFRAGQTTGDASQSMYPIKVNSSSTNYIFDFVWDLYSDINCWYGDYTHARRSTNTLYRYVPSVDDNSSDITVREIKLVWSNASVFFQKGATIVVEGI